MKKRAKISDEVIRLMCNICHVDGFVEDNVLFIKTKIGRWRMIFDGDEIKELYKLDAKNKLQEQNLETTNFFKIMRKISNVES